MTSKWQQNVLKNPNENIKPVFEKIETKNSLGGGNPSDDPTQGDNLFVQAVYSPKNGSTHRFF